MLPGRPARVVALVVLYGYVHTSAGAHKKRTGRVSSEQRIKYCLYARKSSGSEERQVLSID
ncbi:MAG: hypothetical protein JW384_04087 [Nitrosomonadaceae bacterium]|nr:hypothetical protein [Nitrosomonadaceae bacterium]